MKLREATTFGATQTDDGSLDDTRPAPGHTHKAAMPDLDSDTNTSKPEVNIPKSQKEDL
jgi:hypothetical protein